MRALRIFLRLLALTLSLLLTLAYAMAQDMNRLKAGVVRIRNTNPNSGEGGAGFIVKIDKDFIYIVTASHVVTGNGNPAVYLFNHPLDPLSAELINREDESQKGLALLRLRSNNPETFSGLTALRFGASSQIGGGESVRIIGFPGGTSFWDVSAGTLSRVEGNNLVFAGPIRGGNSGGPVILSNGQVAGLVTDTIESQDASYAAKAEIIVSYVNGIVPSLIVIDPKPDVQDQTITLNISLDKFEVYEDGSGGSTRWSFEVFVDTVSMIPLGQKRIKEGTYPIGKSVDIEVVPNKSFTIKVVGDKSEKGVQATGEISLQWNPNRFGALTREISVKVPKEITKGNFSFYFTIKREGIEMSVPAPNLITLSKSTDTGPDNRASNDEFCQTLDGLLEASKNGFYSIVGTPTNAENTFSPKIMMPGATVGFVSPPKRVHYRLLTDKEKGKVESQFYRSVSKVRGCSPKWEEKEASDSSYRFHKFRKNEGGVVVAVYYNPVAQREYFYLILDVAVPDQRRREW